MKEAYIPSELFVQPPGQVRESYRTRANNAWNYNRVRVNEEPDPWRVGVRAIERVCELTGQDG